MQTHEGPTQLGQDAAERLINLANSEQKSLRSAIETTSPESVARLQQESLNKVVANGVLDVFKGTAQRLKSLFPDIELRMSHPTGNPSDKMVIALDYGFETMPDGNRVFHQIYAHEATHTHKDDNTSIDEQVLHIVYGSADGGPSEDSNKGNNGGIGGFKHNEGHPQIYYFHKVIADAIREGVRTPDATRVSLTEGRPFQLIQLEETSDK